MTASSSPSRRLKAGRSSRGWSSFIRFIISWMLTRGFWETLGSGAASAPLFRPELEAPPTCVLLAGAAPAAGCGAMVAAVAPAGCGATPSCGRMLVAVGVAIAVGGASSWLRLKSACRFRHSSVCFFGLPGRRCSARSSSQAAQSGVGVHAMCCLTSGSWSAAQGTHTMASMSPLSQCISSGRRFTVRTLITPAGQPTRCSFVTVERPSQMPSSHLLASLPLSSMILRASTLSPNCSRGELYLVMCSSSNGVRPEVRTAKRFMTNAPCRTIHGRIGDLVLMVIFKDLSNIALIVLTMPSTRRTVFSAMPFDWCEPAGLVLVISCVWISLLSLDQSRCTASAQLLMAGSPSVCNVMRGYPSSFRKALPNRTANGSGPFLITAPAPA